MDPQIWSEYETGMRLCDREEMSVSLWANGVFRLNGKAFKAMGKPDAVRLFINKSERVVAFVPADPRTRNALPFRCQNGNEGRILSALGFCRHFGILPAKVVSFDPPSISPERAMTIDLKSHNLGPQEPD